jgi:hypothetical protein
MRQLLIVALATSLASLPACAAAGSLQKVRLWLSALPSSNGYSRRVAGHLTPAHILNSHTTGRKARLVLSPIAVHRRRDRHPANYSAQSEYPV